MPWSETDHKTNVGRHKNIHLRLNTIGRQGTVMENVRKILCKEKLWSFFIHSICTIKGEYHLEKKYLSVAHFLEYISE